MLREPSFFESVTNLAVAPASDYAGLSSFWRSNLYENPVAYSQPQETARRTNASATILRFLQAVRSEFHDTVVGSALGVFDGDLYLWLFIQEVDTELTRSLFALKSAVEQQLSGEFEIHVEPLGDRRVDELTPSGYDLISI